ncbi:MAG TPA: protein-L-isoaspartate O-methyltransferase [Aestuariivirga sp.]|nr:protein-L-isoaspartate O-methyltransferase [Aestuariivirga sp.]
MNLPKRNLGGNYGLVSIAVLDQAKLDDVRRSYARALGRVSGSHDPPLEEAFYRVHREAFLPPGPWKLLVEGQFLETPKADPAHVYQNVAIALDSRKGINNGEPYLHAMWIGAAAPQPGETVTQIGLGMGYYSAILSLLVQPGGRLIGFEIDSDLAETSRRNLSAYENVSVVTGDATSLEVPPSDLIYVSAAVVEPPEHWLMALRPGGRLIFPWRPTVDVALAMLVKRVSAGFEARPLMSCWFIPCAGASSYKGRLLVPSPSSAQRIRSLQLTRVQAPDESAVANYGHCWFSSAQAGVKNT